MRVRPLISALLVVTAVALAACGGESEEEQIEGVVASFAAAVEQKDPGKFCDTVVGERIPEGERCEDQVTDEQLGALGDIESIEVSDIEVDGDSATGQVTATVAGEEMTDEANFRKVGGDWKLSLDE